MRYAFLLDRYILKTVRQNRMSI